MAVFTYSISRPITPVWFTPSVLGLGLLYVVIITVINVASVGYNNISYTSTAFNDTHTLWFDKFVPGRGSSYNHRVCSPFPLALNDGKIPSKTSHLTITIVSPTNSYFNFFIYQFIDFTLGQNDAIEFADIIDTFNYSNNAFRQCTVNTLALSDYDQTVPNDLKSTVKCPDNHLLTAR